MKLIKTEQERIEDWVRLTGKVNIQRFLEVLSQVAKDLRGTPRGKPTNPAIVFLKNFGILYLAHGATLLVFGIIHSMPMFVLYTEFWLCIETLLAWPIAYATNTSWLMSALFLLCYFAVSIYPAALSVPAYSWQEKLDKLQQEADAKAADQVAALAKAEKATLAVEGQLRAVEGRLADEQERGAAAERELRNQLSEAAQRERLLLFQRDAADRSPTHRIYDAEPDMTTQARRDEPRDPIEEIYG